MSDFLGEFIGNPGRAKILRALISNDARGIAVPAIAKQVGLSAQIAHREMEALRKIGIVQRVKDLKGKASAKKQDSNEYWTLNRDFKHLRSLSEFVQETSPVEFKNVEHALKRSGRLSAVVLSGIFMGDPSRPADLLIAGDALNERRLDEAVRGLDSLFGRELRYAAFSTPEFRYRLTIQDRLIRDTLDFPHRILFSRNGIFKNA